MPWLPSFPRPAQLVAESLRRLSLPGDGPLVTAVAPARAIAAAIARALAPPRAADPPPPWLHPPQHESFSRTVAALRSARGALLADPVGAGKTWIALAAARCLEERAVCIVPATLEEHWRRQGRRAEVPLVVQTHEAWSRQDRRLPPGLVIVDESHRFRNPATARYRRLAPALVGRQVLLLTATPVVNHFADLSHQLALALPDDLFAASGTLSLADALCLGAPPPTLDRVVIASTDPPGRPHPVERALSPPPEERRAVAAMARRLDTLRLSTAPATANLIRGVLAHALASSPAALREVLSRYRKLLLQQQDAHHTGHQMSRSGLRRTLAGDMDQLVWWSLLPAASLASDLDASDLPRLEPLIARLARTRHDPKADRLAALLADGKVTLVFVAARATVHHLRRYLTPASRIAWCCGRDAGIGPTRLPRSHVLTWFRPRARGLREGLAPRVLVTTDVASEGLDLHRAGRVVHYDLPWTTVRLSQRTGRATRPGSSHATVEVVRFDLPPALERRLGLEAALTRKAALPGSLGLEGASRSWTWRRRCVEALGDEIAVRGFCRILVPRAVTLAAAELWCGQELISTHALARLPGQPWTEAPDLVEAALREAGQAERSWPMDRAVAGRVLASLTRHFQPRLIAIGTARLPRQPEPLLSAAIMRVQAIARTAWQQRRADEMEVASQAMAFLQRGMTAGERTIAAAISRASAGDLATLLAGLPPPRPARVPGRLVVIGIVRQGPR